MSVKSSRRWQDWFSDSVLSCWYGSGRWTLLLLPLSWLFKRLARKRCQKYLGAERWEPPVPVVVVGNISIGGTGKTPVVATLVQALLAKGYKPGIASRGFGAQSRNSPLLATPDSNPLVAGDEPVMLAKQLRIPVMVDVDRVTASRALIEQCHCDIVITDDGLQHYRLKRHVELVVIDGQRMLGNQYCLPAGPLREPPERLHSVDQVLVNGQPEGELPVPFDCFYLEVGELCPVGPVECPPPEPGVVHAVAGIGNPERFFKTLKSLGFKVIPHSFPDHHQFMPADLQFGDDRPVLMTAKDAVKCQRFAGANCWYLPVQAHLPAPVLEKIIHLIETKGSLTGQ